MNKILTILATSFLAISSNNFANDFNKTLKASPQINVINYSHSTEEEIQTYYSNLKKGDKGDSLLDNLQNILKENQIKVNYDSGYIQGGKSTARYGYYLYERNRDLSPLEESEKEGKFKTSDIWVNVMYLNSPIYIENGVNKRNTSYKYYPNYPDTTTVKTGTFKSGVQFDREHVLPKSYGFNGVNGDKEAYRDLIVGCDAHNLHMADGVGNQQGHNNLPFGEVVNVKEEIISSVTNEIVGYVGTGTNGNEVFEPLDKDKGDIARSIFYMAARYHNYENLGEEETPSIVLGNKVNRVETIEPSETKDNPAIYGELDDLLAWNSLDPVTDFEKYRNDLIYNNIQGNRNPFVDFPSWADACFNPENSNGIEFSNTNNQEPATYKISLKLKDNSKNSYNFLDKIDLRNFETSVTKSDESIKDPEISFYLDNQEIKNGDTLTSIGSKEIVAKAFINGRVVATSNSVTINISFSIVQIVVAVAIILVILIIFIVIFTKLSKKQKNKVKKAIKKNLKKR